MAKLSGLIDWDARMEMALQFLSTTDYKCADLKASVARTEYMAKLQEAFAYKASSGTVEERKAEAKMDDTSQKRWDVHFSAITEYEQIRAKRETEALVVEVWRSLGANRRAGQV